MSKRVCFIRQAVYPHELSHRREVETVLRAGYETHVICLAAEGETREQARTEVINGVQVHRLPLQRKKSSVARYLMDYLAFLMLAAFKVTALHLRRPFRVIQVNTMPDFLVFATLLPKLLGAKVVLVMHEPVPELWQTLRGSPPPGLLVLVEQLALAYADAVFTVTEQLKQVYVARGAAADKISVILNTPEPEILAEASAQAMLTTSESHFTLLCHGAIEERYGHGTMLEAMVRARQRLPNLRLHILGEGSYLEEFLAKKKSLDLDDCVHYLGYVPLARMVQELRNADAGIVAQEASPYSHLVHTNKMYEYLAFGKPVIASRLNSVSAYFDSDSLAYFTPGDPEDLARVIVELAQCSERRQRLVNNSQRLYARYHWKRQQEIYLSVYRRWTGED
jgi:glycosyltransferase involved in cell wall biosynthesis